MTVRGRTVVALNALIELLPTPSAPGVARRVVAELLDGWEVRGQVLDDTTLIVSELVTNAVEHAGGDASLELAVSRYGDLLRISLADASPIHPTELQVDHRAARGRGGLIAVLSRRWGAEAHRSGKRVWCEIPSPADSRSQSEKRHRLLPSRLPHRTLFPSSLTSGSTGH